MKTDEDFIYNGRIGFEAVRTPAPENPNRYTVFEKRKIRSSYSDYFTINHGPFQSKEVAQKFVDEHTNPTEIPIQVYSDICRCGVPNGWSLFSTEDIVFERCNNCLMPFRADRKDELNALALSDFDLDDFLGE